MKHVCFLLAWFLTNIPTGSALFSPFTPFISLQKLQWNKRIQDAMVKYLHERKESSYPLAYDIEKEFNEAKQSSWQRENILKNNPRCSVGKESAEPASIHDKQNRSQSFQPKLEVTGKQDYVVNFVRSMSIGNSGSGTS